MIFYTFYTNWQKTSDAVKVRTEDGWADIGASPKLFETEDEARKDFMRILWDNEDFRVLDYTDTDPKKKRTTKEKQIKPAKVLRTYENMPEDLQCEVIYNEDCLITMSRMPDGFVDKILTSPPYNIGSRVSCGVNNAIYIGDEDLYQDYDDEQTDEYYEEWLNVFIDQCIRVTKDHVFMNIQMLSKNKEAVLRLMGKYHKNIKDIIIWNKSIAPPHIQAGCMNCAFEFIFIFSNQKPWQKKFDDGNFQGTFRNVIEGVNASQNEYKHLNKATFPLYLPRTILNMFGKKNELIYDPCMGTGTTAIAAVVEDRRWIGSELDKDQIDVALMRIQRECNKLKLPF